MNKILTLILLITSFSCSVAKSDIEQNNSSIINKESVIQKEMQINTPVTKKSIKFVAAAIKSNGDITPVAKIDFYILPYNEIELRKSIILKNKAPKEPSLFEDKYLNIGDLDLMKKTFLDDYNSWEKIAEVGLAEEILKQSNGLSKISFKTDLSGEAKVDLPLGVWFISGFWKNSDSSISWKSVKIDVTSDLEKFELSNDNGNFSRF